MTKQEEKKMKMLDIDLQTHIEAAEDSLRELQNALTSLESDIFWHNGQNIVKGLLSTAVFSAVGCAAGYLVGLAVVPAVGAGKLLSRRLVWVCVCVCVCVFFTRNSCCYHVVRLTYKALYKPVSEIEAQSVRGLYIRKFTTDIRKTVNTCSL